jgi:type II secretory pathway pseudopilin PulG
MNILNINTDIAVDESLFAVPKIEKVPVSKDNLKIHIMNDEEKNKEAIRDLRGLYLALERFKNDFEHYPQESEGLSVLIKRQEDKRWKGPYYGGKPTASVKGNICPLDPWGHKYIYKLLGSP